MTFLKKILLVDYEPRVTAIVRRALEATGKYIVKEEHDSRVALTSAKFFQPDLVLFDLIMARPQGRDLARELQADPSFKGTPVAFVSVNTASAEGSVMSAGILSGYSFLANPVRIEEFVRCVGELVSPTPKPAKSSALNVR